jgi:hypothetical protein
VVQRVSNGEVIGGSGNFATRERNFVSWVDSHGPSQGQHCSEMKKTEKSRS